MKNNRFPIKHVQLLIQDEPILRIGSMYHKDLLKKTLEEFGISFEMGLVPASNSVNGPLFIGENYEMVGAGKIQLFNGGEFKFYDSSAHYSLPQHSFATNKKHLEKLGFKISKEGIEGLFKDPFYYAQL